MHALSLIFTEDIRPRYMTRCCRVKTKKNEKAVSVSQLAG